MRQSSYSWLARDPVIWCGVLAYTLVVAPFFLPGSSRESLAWWTELYATMVVVSVVVASLELGFKNRLPRSAQLFRHIFAAAFFILLVKDLVYVMLPESVFWENVYAGTYGYGYVFYYFVAFAAFAVVPHRNDRGVERAWLWLIRPLGALLLVLGLVVYFLGIPFANYVVQEPGAKSHYILGYVALDIALVALVLRLRQSTESPLWRSVYGWFALAFGLGFGVDALDLIQRFGVLPWVEYGTPLDLLWFAWLAPIIVAARMLAHAPESEAVSAEVFEADLSWLVELGGSRWLVFALSLPILHLAFNTAGILDANLEPARNAFTLLYVVCMGCVAVFHEQLLGRENTRLARERAEVNERLQFARRLEGIGQLAAGIAHDFNNKLTVIQASSELLDEQLGVDDPRKRFTARILKTTEQAAVVVSQLLGFSRKQMSHPKVVDVNAQIEQVASMLKQALGEDIEIALQLEKALPPVKIDPAHLEQILINLAVNARHAMPRGGTLSFRTEHVSPSNGGTGARPAEVIVTVSDSGTGMSDAVKARAFEPFFTTKPTGEGTGLGLATVFGLVQQNNGGIELKTEFGVGTRFRVRFPASGGAVDEVLAPSSRVERARGAHLRRRILLVEDEPAVRELTRELLEPHGYTVREAANGDDALRIALSEDAIDILVTDVVMPGMSGPQLAREIERRSPDVKVLFVSGYAAPDEAGTPLVPYLQKPYTTVELIEALDALCAVGPDAPAPTPQETSAGQSSSRH